MGGGDLANFSFFPHRFSRHTQFPTKGFVARGDVPERENVFEHTENVHVGENDTGLVHRMRRSHMQSKKFRAMDNADRIIGHATLWETGKKSDHGTRVRHFFLKWRLSSGEKTLSNPRPFFLFAGNRIKESKKMLSHPISYTP